MKSKKTIAYSIQNPRINLAPILLNLINNLHQQQGSSWGKQASFIGLRKEIEATGITRHKLIVYPQITHYPGKEQQGKAMFVTIKARFIPGRDVFGFDSMLAVPQDEPQMQKV